jgi:hypothetical protein
MKPTDVLSLPFEWGSAVRHARVFHPRGVLLSGTVDRLAEEGHGLPLVSGPVIARFSKAVGLPGALPDIGGLALRVPSTDPSRPDWDVLLVTVFRGLLGRAVLRPVTAWHGPVFSTLAPLDHDGQTWWLRATVATDVDAAGLSLDAVAAQVRAGGVRIDVEQALGTGDFSPLARVTLTGEAQAGDVSFDPVRNRAPGVRLLPGWLNDLRESAYRRSRQGRHAN